MELGVVLMDYILESLILNFQQKRSFKILVQQQLLYKALMFDRKNDTLLGGLGTCRALQSNDRLIGTVLVFPLERQDLFFPILHCTDIHAIRASLLDS